MKTSESSKVFCIGMNKTGTSSLHEAFMTLGLNAIHYGPASCSSLAEHLEKGREIARNMRKYKADGLPLLRDISNYDAFSDIGPIINFFELIDEQNPGSKFIYTERDTAAWVKSRIKHVQRNRVNIKKGRYQSSFTEIEPEKWAQSKEEHFQRVMMHFAEKPEQLLIMNISHGDGYEKLCPFLGLPIRNEDFPKKNVASSE